MDVYKQLIQTCLDEFGADRSVTGTLLTKDLRVQRNTFLAIASAGL